MHSYCIKTTIITPDNIPTRTANFFNTVGVESEVFCYQVTPKNILDVVVSQLNIKPTFKKFLPVHASGSSMNSVLINADRLDDEKYRGLCTEAIKIVDEINRYIPPKKNGLCVDKDLAPDAIPPKPTIILWGNSYFPMLDFELAGYPVFQGVNQEEAITSAIENLFINSDLAPPGYLELKLLRTSGSTSRRSDLEREELEIEREMIHELFPKVTTTENNYQVPIGPLIFKKNHRDNNRFVMDITPMGQCSVYDKEKKKKELVCLVLPTNGDMECEAYINDEYYQFSQGGLIAASLANGALDDLGSAAKNIKNAFKKLVGWGSIKYL